MSGLQTTSIDITYKCNFRCKHCYNSSGEHLRNNRELSDEKILKLVDELCDLNIESLCLCGGETMLRKELVYKVAKLKTNKQKDMTLSIVSNGYLIKEKEVQEIASCGIDQVQISLDGRYPETHDWLRNKKGSFEHAINAIRMLISHGMQVAIAFSPTKKNHQEFEDVIDYMFELGVKSIRAQPLMVLGRCRDNLVEYLLSNHEYMKMKYIINKKTQEYAAEGLEIEWGDPLAHLYHFADSGEDLKSLVISAYGELLASPYLPVSFGNVKKGSVEDYLKAGLKNVWGFPIMKEIVSHISSVNDMDVSKIGLPEIFKTDIVELDLLTKGWRETEKKIIKNITKYK